jgi:ring-1,2-phenylacetyl-CoA epoxidase subunit PaaD
MMAASAILPGTKGIWDMLNTIPDPEVPAISIVELGVIRNVEEKEGRIVITMTPTYSGCPALKMMEENVRTTLYEAGLKDVDIRIVLYPAWTTDWIPEEAKLKLRNYGIAPPERSTEDHLKSLLSGKKHPVTCPFCHSADTRLTSAFGSTACKALHYCNHCHQPFEEFKCH